MVRHQLPLPGPRALARGRFRLAARPKPLAELAEARELGIATRPVLLGPVTFLLLGKPSATTRRWDSTASSACSTRCWRCTPSCWTSWRPPGPSGSSWTSRPSSRTARRRAGRPGPRLRPPRAAPAPGPSCSSPATSTTWATPSGCSPARPVDGIGLDLTRAAPNLDCWPRGGSATGPWSPGSSMAATCGRTARAVAVHPATLLGLAGEVVVSSSCSSSTSRSTWTPSSPSTPRSGRGWPSPARRWPR